jgi:hypothetical protein
MNYRNPQLLALARDQACTNCGSLHGVVAAHSNWSRHGKGKSIKAHDCFHAWLCFSCHGWLDQGGGYDPTGMFAADEKLEMYQRAADKTLLRLWQDGHITLKGKR